MASQQCFALVLPIRVSKKQNKQTKKQKTQVSQFISICPDLRDKHKIKRFNYNPIRLPLSVNAALNTSLRCLSASSMWPRQLTKDLFTPSPKQMYNL